MYTNAVGLIAIWWLGHFDLSDFLSCQCAYQRHYYANYTNNNTYIVLKTHVPVVCTTDLQTLNKHYYNRLK